MNLAELKLNQSSPLKQASLCFLLHEGQILLAMKKRGFGIGKYNGVGGKQHKGETIEQTTIREAQEEIGVSISNLHKVAELDFYFTTKIEWNQKVTVFTTDS